MEKSCFSCGKNKNINSFYKFNFNFYCYSCCMDCEHCEKIITKDNNKNCKDCNKKICLDCSNQETNYCIDNCCNVCTKEGKTKDYDKRDGYYWHFPEIYHIKYKQNDGTITTKIACEECYSLCYSCHICNKKEYTINGICSECTVDCNVCKNKIRKFSSKCELCQKMICENCQIDVGFGDVCKNLHTDQLSTCGGCKKESLTEKCEKGHDVCYNCLMYGLSWVHCEVCEKQK